MNHSFIYWYSIEDERLTMCTLQPEEITALGLSGT